MLAKFATFTSIKWNLGSTAGGAGTEVGVGVEDTRGPTTPPTEIAAAVAAAAFAIC